MGASLGAGPDGVRAPWLVRISDVAGNVRGAGMVVGSGCVLTCAQVVQAAAGNAPGSTVVIDFVGVPGVPPTTAKLAADGWVAPGANRRGNVALLDLARPVTQWAGAPLRRMPLGGHRVVHTVGFARSPAAGGWVPARLGGETDPDGEWIRLDAVDPAQRLTWGVSGSPVVDDRTGSVIGMVVSPDGQPHPGRCWMIPVETLVRHLPAVATWVSGASAVDPQFADRLDHRRSDAGVARRVADFFTRKVGRRAQENVLVVITGEVDSPAATALSRAVVLSDPERRPADPAGTGAAADDTVPPVGSIDLALDVSGMTVAQVSRHIVDRMGISLDESTEPMDVLADEGSIAMVFDGIDQAVDPAALMTEVFKPLAARAEERDIRLLLGFRSDSSPSLIMAQSLDPGVVRSSGPDSNPAVPATTVRDRLDLLAARVTSVQAAERATWQLHARVAARIADVPAPPSAGAALRQQLSEIRAAHQVRDAAAGVAAGPGGPDPDRVLAKIDACTGAADRALRRAERARQQLEGLLDRRDELRGRLAAYKARAADHGRIEDTALAALYRQAQRLLWHGPCELPAAAEAVERYVHSVRTALTPGEPT